MRYELKSYKSKKRKTLFFRRIRSIIILFLLVFLFSKGFDLISSRINKKSSMDNLQIGNEILMEDEKEVVVDPNRKTILIDPGHGGNDSGTIGTTGTYEKDINLSISKKLYAALKENGYGAILSRIEDEFMDRYERVDFANKTSADVLISIHANAIEKYPDVTGTEILYFPTANDENMYSSKNLAEIIIENLTASTTSRSRGAVPRKDLILLIDTKMPSILIETGFLSNVTEEALLKDSDYQDLIVQGIIDGLDAYFAQEEPATETEQATP